MSVSDNTAIPTATQVTFIDTSLPDYQTLIEGLPEGMEVVLVGPDQDGVQVMSEWAATHSNYEAIHVLGHGSNGAQQLGSATLSTDTLNQYQAQLAQIGASLSEDGDILLYGCYVAADQTGVDFIGQLAQLTSADIAASEDLTGAEKLTGDWTLELSYGAVTAKTLDLSAWNHTLVTTEFTGSLDGSNQFYRPWTPSDVIQNNFEIVYSGSQITETSSDLFNYSAAYFTPASSGLFTFSISNSSSIDDTFLAVYEEEFSPTSPLTNLMYANDDSGTGYHPTIPDISLTAGTTYILVVTSYDAGETGSIAFSVDGVSGGTFTDDPDEVPAVNNVPEISGVPTDISTLEEDTQGNIDLSNVTFADTDGDTLTVTLTASVGTFSTPADGSGVGSGVTETLVSSTVITLVGSAADINTYLDTASNIRYTGAANAYGNDAATITVTANDGTDNLASNPTINLDITAVNDGPTDISLSGTSIAQSAGADAEVGTLSSTDVDSSSFTYTLVAGTDDTDNASFNISGNSLQANDASTLNEGSYSVRVQTDDGSETYEEAFTINVTDDIVPTVAIAPSGSPAGNATSVDFTVTFSESVNGATVDDFSLTTTDTAAGAITDVTGSGSSYTVTVSSISGAGALRLDLNGSTDISDGSNAPAAFTGGTTHTVDTVAPIVSSVSVPSNGTYKIGDTLDFTVNFSENITLTGTNSTLGLDIGSNSVNAVYQSATANSITYRYTVQTNDLDTDGISVGSLALNTDTIRDSASNDASLTLNSVGSTAAVLVDGVPPGTPAGTLSINENAANSNAVGTIASTDAVAFSLTDNAGGRFAIDNSGNLTVANGSLLNYEANTSHNITVQATDAAGNTSSQTLSVTVNDVNEAPTASDKTLTVQKNNTLTIATSDLGYSDVDSDTLNQITITTAPTTGSLWVDSDNDGTITGSEAALVDSNTVSKADLDAGKLKYKPVDNATGTSYTTIVFKVNDGELDAASSNTFTIDVVNAPEIDLNGAITGNNVTDASYTENDSNTYVSVVAADATISDDDANLTGLSIQLSSGTQTGDVIKLGSRSNSDIVNGITITYNSDTQITLSGTTSKANYETLLKELSFAQNGDAIGGSARTISITATDESSNTGPASTITVSVTGINDAPTLTNGTQTITYNEDAAATDLSPTAFGLTDADGSFEDQVTVTLTLSDKNAGVIADSGNDGTFTASTGIWSYTGTVANALTQMNELTFTPAENYDQDSTIAISVEDGKENSVVAQTGSLTLDITAVNDAPESADTTKSVSYNGTYTFQESDFSFSDVDTGDALDHITIKASPTAGTLTFNGGALTSTDFPTQVTKTELDEGKLKFTPASGASGNAYAKFDFTISDGEASSATEYKFTMNVGNPPAPTPPPAPAPTVVVDGAEVTTQTEQDSQGNEVEVVTVAPVTSERQDTDSTSSNADLPFQFEPGNSNNVVTTLSLPTGLGVRVLSSNTASSQNQVSNFTNLVRGIEGDTEDSLTAQSAGSTFLNTVPVTNNVFVNSIQVTSSGSTVNDPLVITGTANAGNTEAFVIDLRTVPSTHLQLDNIEFASIVGSATIKGGAGENFVIGDSESQFIVLGADDDELHGGGGNDTIGSKGGDDKLYGDSGNDLVVGGTGNDTLYGGTGNDVLQGGQSAQGSATFYINDEGEIVTSFTPTDSDLSDTQGFSFSGDWYSNASLIISGKTVALDLSEDNISNVLETGLMLHATSEYALVAQDSTQVLAIASGYLSLFGDRINTEALSVFSSTGRPLEELAEAGYQAWLNMQTDGFTERTTQEQVSTMLQSFWLESDITESAINDAMATLATSSWGELLLSLARSSQAQAKLVNEQGLTQLTQNHTITEGGLSTDIGNDFLYGGDGDDTLIGGHGNDLLDGGEGIDTAVQQHLLAEYAIAQQEDGSITLTYQQGAYTEVDTLVGVEWVQFSDQLISTADLL